MTLIVSTFAKKLTHALILCQEYDLSGNKEHRLECEQGKRVLGSLKKFWSDNEEALEILTLFENKPQRYAPVFEDIVRENISTNDQDFKRLCMMINSKDKQGVAIDGEEIKVMKAIDSIGGGGTPIDIALEGMLDINRTKEVTERLWGKGLLHSFRTRDNDEKRFFSFSDLGEKKYLDILKEEKSK